MVYVGEIVNTHGIKGELRIISDFKYKDKVFFVGNKLYLGKRKQKVVINSAENHPIENLEIINFNLMVDILKLINIKKIHTNKKK